MSVQPAPPAILALLLLLGTIPRQPVNAQEASAPLVLTRITEPVVIDGVPNDPVWRDVPALPSPSTRRYSAARRRNAR